MKKFEQLTLKGQKMRIVRDAIKQIKSRVVIPNGGSYLSNLCSGHRFNSSKGSLQAFLQKPGNSCQACAKGALFASCVLNVNKVNIDGRIGTERFQKKKLRDWFTPEELDTIEAAFENRVVADSAKVLTAGIRDCWGDRPRTALALKAISFGNRYRSNKNCLLAILNNILKNGSFKP